MKIRKAALRKEMRERLARLTPSELREKSRRICDRIRALPEWQTARTVVLYAALPGEPDIEFLWQPSKLGQKRVCYPRIDGEELRIHEVKSSNDLEPSRWSLREPSASHATSVPAADADLLLVPGIAFDSFCRRLGRGGGFFDRFLALPDFRALKIGVCFAFQKVEEVPHEGHDVAMDVVVTEEGAWPAGEMEKAKR